MGASVGVAGQRITTTPLAAARAAAHSDPHPVAVAPLAALQVGHRLVVEAAGHLVVHHPRGHRLAVEAPGHPVVALVHRPHGRRVVAEAPGHPVVALAHHPHEHRLVVAPQARQQVAGLAHPEPVVQARLDRVHHLAALALRVHHLAVAQPAQAAVRAPAAVASSVAEAAVPVRVVAVSSVEEAAHVRVVADSLVVAAAGAAQVALEAAGDDRFSLCNGRRLGFHHAAQQWF